MSENRNTPSPQTFTGSCEDRGLPPCNSGSTMPRVKAPAPAPAKQTGSE